MFTGTFKVVFGTHLQTAGSKEYHWNLEQEAATTQNCYDTQKHFYSSGGAKEDICCQKP